MKDMKYVIETGVPTAGTGEPVEIQGTSTTLARDVKRIDSKMNLLLKALGVSTASLEEDTDEAN
ncbi:hypothetical protein I050019G5_12890 [Collinsella sp. i05-0019-G5]|jgi:hypothetical protein|uniref:hypothetical protein n=1 Tax=Collinsella sp. i05-0019-G5 TaxID=3132705 RepID=UPI0036F3CD58